MKRRSWKFHTSQKQQILDALNEAGNMTTNQLQEWFSYKNSPLKNRTTLRGRLSEMKKKELVKLLTSGKYKALKETEFGEG